MLAMKLFLYSEYAEADSFCCYSSKYQPCPALTGVISLGIINLISRSRRVAFVSHCTQIYGAFKRSWVSAVGFLDDQHVLGVYHVRDKRFADGWCPAPAALDLPQTTSIYKACQEDEHNLLLNVMGVGIEPCQLMYTILSGDNRITCRNRPNTDTSMAKPYSAPLRVN